MRLFGRKYKATKEEKEQGKRIARENNLPQILRELPPGLHSYERRLIIQRIVGYKRIFDSIDTYKIICQGKELLEKRCKELGIMPVFKGDYITLDSFPRKNIIKEEIIGIRFRGGKKIIEKKYYFDILEYIKKK